MHVTTPKTSASCRIIPMLQKIRKMLIVEGKRQMLGACQAEIYGHSGLVFGNKNGYVLNPQTVSRAIQGTYTEYNDWEREKAD